jgi:hypothetical protein
VGDCDLAKGSEVSFEPETPPQARENWERLELLRRLYAIIEQSSVMEVARRLDVAKASLYRWMWAERRPSYDNLVALYRAYPEQFPELKLLLEDE